MNILKCKNINSRTWCHIKHKERLAVTTKLGHLKVIFFKRFKPLLLSLLEGFVVEPTGVEMSPQWSCSVSDFLLVPIVPPVHCLYGLVHILGHAGLAGNQVRHAGELN